MVQRFVGASRSLYVLLGVVRGSREEDRVFTRECGIRGSRAGAGGSDRRRRRREDRIPRRTGSKELLDRV
jgi:hypothetical protein